MNRRERRALKFAPFSENRMFYNEHLYHPVRVGIAKDMHEAWVEYFNKSTDVEYIKSDVLWDWV